MLGRGDGGWVWLSADMPLRRRWKYGLSDVQSTKMGGEMAATEMPRHSASRVFQHRNEMKVNYTSPSWSKQLCFIDKVLRRVSFQWMYKNHPLIILIWYIMTSSTSLFTVRGIHYCYCCWDLGQKYLCAQTKNSQKQQTGDWYCRYGILECHKTLE